MSRGWYALWQYYAYHSRLSFTFVDTQSWIIGFFWIPPQKETRLCGFEHTKTTQQNDGINCYCKQIYKSLVNPSNIHIHSQASPSTLCLFIDLMMEVKNDGKFISCRVAHFDCHKYPKRKDFLKLVSILRAWWFSTIFHILVIPITHSNEMRYTYCHNLFDFHFYQLFQHNHTHTHTPDWGKSIFPFLLWIA